MKKGTCKKSAEKDKKPCAVSYRLKCKKTANGLSHYVPTNKKTLV